MVSICLAMQSKGGVEGSMCWAEEVLKVRKVYVCIPDMIARTKWMLEAVERQSDDQYPGNSCSPTPCFP